MPSKWLVMNIIKNIEKNSIAEEMGIEKEDFLISINNNPIIDIFDYTFHIKNEYIEVLIRKSNNTELLLEIDKKEDEDLGLEFEHPLLNREKTCKNKCIFCFIDQNPPNMRKTIYFKDDDSRLSFLNGNFVTLTNMNDSDLDRIIYYKLSPINISVHSTDPDIREFILKNPKSRDIQRQIQKLAKGGIELNFQIVLCKGINDGQHLDKTIETLSKFIPKARSLAIVPAGLTKHRNNLPILEKFTKDDIKEIIDQVNNWQYKLKNVYDTRFVFLADEFYLLANQSLPPEEEYENYPQIENGVGMLRSFSEEFNSANFLPGNAAKTKEISVITGKGAYGFMRNISKIIEKKYGVKIFLYPITNNFYGESVTVSGLLTGKDIMEQLISKPLGEKLLLPANTLKSQEDILLDNTTLSQIEKNLKVKIVPVNINGEDFLYESLGIA